MLKLISTDFDGTLHADHEDPPVPLDLQALIGRLQGEGAKWVINTGRDLSSLMEGIARARLTIRPDYVVVVEREIYVHEGPQFIEFKEWNHHCARQHAELFMRVRPDLPRLFQWMNDRQRAVIYADAYSPLCFTAESNEEADVLQKYLEEYCAEIPGLTLVRNDIYARFSHVDFNKGTALAEIARRLGVTPPEIFAAGDHFNDLSMLSGEHAHCVVAVDNAMPVVKETVRRANGYVSHQPWGHGVARGLEFYLERGGSYDRDNLRKR